MRIWSPAKPKIGSLAHSSRPHINRLETKTANLASNWLCDWTFQLTALFAGSLQGTQTSLSKLNNAKVVREVLSARASLLHLRNTMNEKCCKLRNYFHRIETVRFVCKG